MEEIAPNVYVESGYYGVTVGAIVTSEGIICVDSPILPADARDWRLRLAGLTRKPVRYLIYTDAQRERVLGSQYLGGIAVAHELTWETMKGYGDAFRQQTADFLAHRTPEAALEVVTNLRIVLPQITFTNRLTLYSGPTAIVLEYVRGPTPCNLWVLLPEQDVLFAGDVVTLNTHPILAETDVESWLVLLRKLGRKRPPAKVVIPGRGGVTCDKGHSKQVADYVRAVRRRVRALIRRGRSRPDVARLVEEFLPYFPILEGEHEHIQRRIKAGLDRIYDVYRNEA